MFWIHTHNTIPVLLWYAHQRRWTRIMQPMIWAMMFLFWVRNWCKATFRLRVIQLRLNISLDLAHLIRSNSSLILLPVSIFSWSFYSSLTHRRQMFIFFPWAFFFPLRDMTVSLHPCSPWLLLSLSKTHLRVENEILGTGAASGCGPSSPNYLCEARVGGCPATEIQNLGQRGDTGLKQLRKPPWVPLTWEFQVKPQNFSGPGTPCQHSCVTSGRCSKEPRCLSGLV